MSYSANRCDQLKQVRKIRPSRRSVSGVYPFRGLSSVAYESTLERDFVVKHEFYRHVLDVIPQPVQIEWCDARGAVQSYIPDYMVYFKLGARSFENYPKPLLVEVKPRLVWKKHWRAWLSKWKAARRYAIETGAEFRIWDESRIRDQAFDNISFLERYKRMQFDEEDCQQVLETVDLKDVATMDYLLARHFLGIYRAEGIALIWHLLAMRRLDCDIRDPLGPLTALWIPRDE